MTATALLDPPPGRTLARAPGAARIAIGSLLGRDVLVEADQQPPYAALDRLLAQLNEQWDVRRRHSDLDRLTHYPNVMVAVTPPTLLLVRNALAGVRLARAAGLDPGPCLAAVDARHGRVGVDPLVAAVAARLIPATAADLLAELCEEAGATTGWVRVGDVVRPLGEPVPAWLQQAANDIEASAGARGEPGQIQRRR